MSEQIIINIKKLGSVRNTKITLGQFMIFSGASGLGKSYVAMLVHYVYRVLTGDELSDFFNKKGVDLSEVLKIKDGEQHIVLSCSSKDFIQWVNSHAREYMAQILGYPELIMDVDITIPDLPETFDFVYQQMTMTSHNKIDVVERAYLFIKNVANTRIGFTKSLLPQVTEMLFSAVLEHFLRELCELRNINTTLFFPPSRGAIVQLSSADQIRIVQSSPIYGEFIETMSKIKNGINRSADHTIDMRSVIDGEIETEENEITYKCHGVPVPITAAASSIKEIAPFVLMAQNGYSRYSSILFEEPESHLHPEMQNAIVDTLAIMIQQRAHLQITTHSDYVLRRINDLIYLAKLKEIWPEKQYVEYCKKYSLDSNVILDPSKIKAYYFKSDKNGTSIVEEQDLSDGVPFDTFEKVIDKNFPISADIYEQFSMITAHD